MRFKDLLRRQALAAVAVAALVPAACADIAVPGADPAPRVAERVEYGQVERIDLYREGASEPQYLGAVIGGLAGGILGHQVGGGNGNTLATVAGALGGAYAGNAIQDSNARDRYRITVRLDNGTRLESTEVGEGELRVGDRVRIVNNRVYRAR
jgi:outer membrane lipoprotein SlyB